MRNKQTKQHKPLDDERVTPLTKDNELDQANNFAGKHHSLKARASNHNNDEQLAQKARDETIETSDHVENLSKNNADRKHDQASKHSKHKSANQGANDSGKQIAPKDKHIPPQTNNEVTHDHAPVAMQHHEKASTHASQTNDLKQRKRRAKTNKDRKRHKNRSTMNQTSKKRTPTKQPTNQVPFNVMMTPGDYRSLDKKSSKKNNYQVPLHLLNDPEQKSTDDDDWVLEQMEILEQTLKHFKVAAEVVNVTQGPTVTRFEVKPAIGVKVSRVRNLSDDIKLNMAAKDIRIEAPIPGKNTIGIEIPNVYPQMVSLQEILQTDEFQQTNKSLAIGLGLNVEGEPLVTSINKMPHGLIAGATGSGKSVCINTILLSLIFKESYNDLKLLLIDPKMVELAPYNDIPHLVSPVITDVKAATAALKWAVNEMEDRYDKFVNEGVRDINRYNEKMAEEGKNDAKLPYIVIVIDELAD